MPINQRETTSPVNRVELKIHAPQMLVRTFKEILRSRPASPATTPGPSEACGRLCCSWG